MNLPRFILAADHRTQFEDYAKKNGTDRALIARFKQVVVQGMVQARTRNASAREHGALLLDTTFGLPAMDDARKAGVPIGEPVEAAGVYPLAFVEGGVESVAQRKPAFAKLLIRIPKNDPDEERAHDSAMVHAAMAALGDIPLYVEPLGDGPGSFNQVADAIYWIDHWLPKGALHHWKVTGDPDASQLQHLVSSAPNGSKFVIFSGGEPMNTLTQWFAAAKTNPAFIGFAVGRTVWWPTFENWLVKKVTDDQAAAEIANRYLEIVALWEAGR
jgi:myo-inositol catabolism protein IolC